MGLNQSLSEEKLELYREAGLTDTQIRLLRTPFSEMHPGESQIAFAARERLDAYRESQA